MTRSGGHPTPLGRQRLLLLAVAIVAIVVSGLAGSVEVLPGDVAVERLVQRAPQPPARWLADFGNWIGSSRFFVVIAVVLAIALLVKRLPWEAALLVGATIARTLNGGLKAIIDSPRPTPDLVRVTEHAHGMGFPSGHAMGSMLGYGAIVLIAARTIEHRAARRAVQALSVGLILLVGFGRIYVGAHWPSDVLGGYLWGVLLLAGIAAFVDLARRRFSAPRPG